MHAILVSFAKFTGWQADVMNDDAANFGLVFLNGACVKIGRADKFCTA